jgi:hypothetical protein
MLPTERVYGVQDWPDIGEIDIMEYVGFDPGRVHGTVHTRAFNGLLGNQRTASRPVPDAESEFHEYAVEWSPERIDVFVDSVRYFGYLNDGGDWTTWPFDREFYLILNLAVGGNWGGLQGVDDSIFPQQLEVDYVRLYRNVAVPQIDLLEPLGGVASEPGDSLQLRAAASDIDGEVVHVEFMQRDGVLARIKEPPYSVTVGSLSPGCYEVRARATDDQGWTVESEAVPVSVGDVCSKAPYLMTPVSLPGLIEAEFYDLGGARTSYSDLNEQNTGYGIRVDEGVDIERSDDSGGGYHLTDISRREWVEYTVEVTDTGVYDLLLRVRPGPAVGSLRLDVDGIDATGPIEIRSGPDA